MDEMQRPCFVSMGREGSMELRVLWKSEVLWKRAGLWKSGFAGLARRSQTGGKEKG